MNKKRAEKDKKLNNEEDDKVHCCVFDHSMQTSLISGPRNAYFSSVTSSALGQLVVWQ